MSAWVTMIGSCFGCSRPFSFNPMRVPSIRVDGDRKPVCQSCINRANALRKAQGLPQHEVHPDAYEPAREWDVF